MNKKIQGKDGKTYVEKKPFYKKVWFWILAVIAVFIIIGVVSGGLDENGGKQENTTSSKQTTKKPKYYKVGDSVTVDKVTYTLNSVEVVNERNQFADENPNYVIKVTYHVKNNSDQDVPIGADLNAYGPNNNKLKGYPINGTTLDAVAAGKEADVVTGFGLDKLGNVELQFAPLVSVHKAAKFKVNVKDNTDSTTNNQQATTNNQQVTTQSNEDVAAPSQQSAATTQSQPQQQVDQSSNSEQATTDNHGISPELQKQLEENHKAEQYINSPEFQQQHKPSSINGMSPDIYYNQSLYDRWD